MSNTKKKDVATHNDTTQNAPSWQVPEPVAIPDKYSTNRTSLTPKNFERLCIQHGVRVRIYRSFFCPNVKDIGGAHNIDCTIPGCDGTTGIIDVDPVETMCLLQRQELIKRQSAEGFVDDSTVMGTFLLGFDLQYFSLVEILDYQSLYFEQIKRSSGDIDATKYNAKTVNVLMDSKGIRYYQTIDFSVDPNGSIKWHINKGPKSGDIYSVHYYANIRFRASKAVQVVRFSQVKNSDGTVSFVKMPCLWELSREFMPKRVDQEGNVIPPNKLEPEDKD